VGTSTADPVQPVLLQLRQADISLAAPKRQGTADGGLFNNELKTSNMPKTYRATLAYRKKELFVRITPDHLIYSTGIFSVLEIGEPDLCERTIRIIQDRYRRWYDSWIREDAELFLLKTKERGKSQ